MVKLLTLTLSHSLLDTVTEATTFSNYLTMIIQLTSHKIFPSCIYTYTTFQLFTDMAHMGHIQTIYNYSLLSWSRNRFSISVSVSVSASAELTTRLGSIFPSQSGGTYLPTHFEYTVMSFDLMNAPAVFQHMANDIVLRCSRYLHYSLPG